MKKTLEGAVAIAEKIRNKEPVLIFLGDKNIYKPIYQWKNDPVRDDVVGFVTKQNEVVLAYVTGYTWNDSEWILHVVPLFDQTNRTVYQRAASKNTLYVTQKNVWCILSKVRSGVIINRRTKGHT
ncbi:MAG: hypothetical protein MN733_28430, partial [Nitrososphaera sp.]|nr:hypothetical protein [Nitrososphaera sp.]